MRITITVRDETARRDGPDPAELLRQWLNEQPELRGRTRRRTTEAPAPDEMGTAADAVLALLEPGGVAAAFAGAVVAWAQTRRGSQTITLRQADGREVTIVSTHVKGLDADRSADLARQLAADLMAPPEVPTGPPDPGLPPPR
ncbi:effector-associated constant component EACC1 [Streptomyces sp. NPDC002755]|uniref:effector-associated constant component EACC1 n=1 Tax=Streptomyces sp. NPDC002884 TaxID=3154544 RepID=UPI00332A8610